MSTEETFVKCGEIHYVWPHPFNRGNTSKCMDCRYFDEDEKSREPFVRTGRCTSKASEADRGHIFTRRVNDNDYCHWWFPLGRIAGEQEGLL